MNGSVFMDTQGLYQRRRAFNMSYRNDLTCCLGEIIPVYWQDLIPNTTWHCRVHGLVRFMPLIAPFLTNVDVYLHWWLSPYRTLYGEEFTKIITGELDSDEWSGVYFTPEEVFGYLFDEFDGDSDVLSFLTGDGSIFDLLGYDSKLFVDQSQGQLNARKLIMYMRLMHDWYANENVEPWSDFLEDYDWKIILDRAASSDGNISDVIGLFVANNYSTWKTAGFFVHQWPKDYFTSALPTLQYGLPTYLPLGDSAPVTVDLTNIKLQGINPAESGMSNKYPIFGFDNSEFEEGDSLEIGQLLPPTQDQAIIGNNRTSDVSSINRINGAIVKNDGTPITATADLSEATAITINELRISNALQVFKEREMRYGRKPQEYYRGFYGVTPGDLRLQMPKFLGGGRMPVNVSDIEQTSQTTSSSPQGNLAGKGTGIAAGFARASAFAPEESFILGVAWLMPKVLYSQQLSRHDTKLYDRFDYYNPSFAHIGEQPVYRYEVYGGVYGTSTGSQEFGYQPRYTEYRFHSSEIHGDLKGNLSYWTLARIFDSTPALNANFIYMQPETLNRIFAVQTTTKGFVARNVILSLQFNCGVIQPLSRYGTPGLMP